MSVSITRITEVQEDWMRFKERGITCIQFLQVCQSADKSEFFCAWKLFIYVTFSL